MRDTEWVNASDIREGDDLCGGRGTVTRVLSDSGLLTFDTTVTCFMKDMHAKVERFTRVEGNLYGLDWSHANPVAADGGLDA